MRTIKQRAMQTRYWRAWTSLLKRSGGPVDGRLLVCIGMLIPMSVLAPQPQSPKFGFNGLTVGMTITEMRAHLAKEAKCFTTIADIGFGDTVAVPDGVYVADSGCGKELSIETRAYRNHEARNVVYAVPQGCERWNEVRGVRVEADSELGAYRISITFFQPVGVSRESQFLALKEAMTARYGSPLFEDSGSASWGAGSPAVDSAGIAWDHARRMRLMRTDVMLDDANIQRTCEERSKAKSRPGDF